MALFRKQRALANVGSPKKVPPLSSVQVHEYGKLIFCKRIFRPLAEIPNDPTEYHLLYAQALHHNVQVNTEIIGDNFMGIKINLLGTGYLLWRRGAYKMEKSRGGKCLPPPPPTHTPSRQFKTL